jgi:hypothetical protein
MYYFEPILTYDLDIFFIPSKEGIDLLSPLHAYLKEKGYQSELVKFLEEARIDGLELGKILKSHGLEEKFGKFKERYREG